MGFTKAEPKQARLKIGMYGPPGSGKTFTTLLMAEGLANHRGKRIAYVDTERGTDFYAQTIKERKVHPEAFDFDALYTRSLKETLEAVMELDPNEYGVVVIDSISHMWDAAIEAYEGKLNSNEQIPMHAWGQIKRPYKALIKYLLESSFDVFILGRQKNVFRDVGGKLEHIGVAMKAEGETQYEPHIQLRLEAVTSKSDTTQWVSMVHVEKDRTGILSGQTLRNAGFKDIEPVLAYLGADEQAHDDNEDERKADDAELFEQAKKKDAEKEAKSAERFQRLHAELSTCTTMDALAEVGQVIKKERRYLVEKHRNALRVTYEELRSRIVSENTPDPC